MQYMALLNGPAEHTTQPGTQEWDEEIAAYGVFDDKYGSVVLGGAALEPAAVTVQSIASSSDPSARSACSGLAAALPGSFTRLTATVTISVPDASCAARMIWCDGYLPVPTMRRLVNLRSAMTSGAEEAVATVVRRLSASCQ